MSCAISKTLLWIVWVFWAGAAILVPRDVSAYDPGLNTFPWPVDPFAASLFLISILTCAGMRFFLVKTHSPWLVQMPFFVGMFLVFGVGTLGLDDFQEYCLAFQVLSGIFFAIYLPLFIRLEPREEIFDPGHPEVTTGYLVAHKHQWQDDPAPARWWEPVPRIILKNTRFKARLARYLAGRCSRRS